MSFEMYGRKVDRVSAREWWNWQEGIFGNVFGWTPTSVSELADGKFTEADGEPEPGVDVMDILTFGEEQSLPVPAPPTSERDYYDLGEDDETPMPAEVFEQLEREIGLGIVWKHTLRLGRGEAILPKRGEAMADYVSRVQEDARERGIEHALDAYRCGVPLRDIIGDEDADASDVHYHMSSWTIRM